MAFCGYLKQSTAATIMLGPFVDEDDGKTAEVGLAIAQADVRLSKNGGNMAQKNDVNAATHDEIGIYSCELDATDTNTLGILDVMVHESGALPVHQTYQVVVAHWWDTMCSTDYLQVDVIQVEGSDATDQINAACDTAIETYGLDHLVSAAVAGADVVDDSIIAQMVADDAVADWDTFNNTTDSLEALRNRGDAAWITGGGTGLSSLATGTAQAGAAGTITLAAGASATNDLFNGTRIALTGGTGDGQSRIITDYDGGTKVASVAPNWTTNPDATSDYEIQASDSAVGWWRGAQVSALSSGRVDADVGAIETADPTDTIRDSVVDDATRIDASDLNALGDVANIASLTIDASGHVEANVVEISNDATAADNLESYCDGTTPQPVNATEISGDSTAADNLELMYDGTGLAAVENAIADAFLDRDMSVGTDANARTPRNALRFLRNAWDIVAGVLTVTKEDDGTTAWQANIADDAAADNVISVTPI